MGSPVGGGARDDGRDRRTYFDVSEYGARPGDTAAAMASLMAAWEAIRARIRALPAGTPTEIYFPPGAWRCDGPLWVDWDNTSIRGASAAATSLTVWNSVASTALLVGLDRAPLGRPFPSNRRPWHWDSGPLDGSTGGYAYRLGGGYHLAAAGTIADVGLAQWAGFQDEFGVRRAPPRQLTVEVAFMYHGAIPHGVQLCGILERFLPGSDWRWRSGCVRPWSLWFSEPAGATPKVTLTIATTNGPEPPHEKGYLPNFSEGREWEVDLGSVPADTLVRLVVQVDLATPAVTAYVGPNQVAATPIRNADVGTGWTAAADLHFVRNECWPFKIGADGRWPTAGGSVELGAAGEFTVYGLAVATALRYRNDGVGQPIKRIDTNAAPPNDRWRYVDDGTGSTAPALWYLGGDLAANCDGRVARLVHGRLANSTTGAQDTALLCDSSPTRWQCPNYAGHYNVTVADLTIASSIADYVDILGAPLVVRGVANFRLERVNLIGGWYGLQALFADTMYPLYLDDVFAQAQGAAVMLVRSEAYIRRLDIGQPGLHGVLLFGGDTAIDGLRSAGWNGRIGHALVKRVPQEWGSTLSLRNLWDDTEGGFTPCEGLVVVERGEYASQCALTIENVAMSKVGRGAPAIALRGRGGQGGVNGADTIGRCDIRGISIYEVPLGGLVAVDTPHWHGTVAEPSVPGWAEADLGRLVVYTDRFGTGVARPNVKQDPAPTGG